jgi:hypothetical protein
MEENRKNKDKQYFKGYGNVVDEKFFDDTENKEPKEVHVKDENRAKMDGKVGDFTSGRTEQLDDASAIPGADLDDDLENAAAGAGLGGNKGRGTQSKSSLD